MGYTWHKVTEEEKEEIRQNSKKLLDEFSSKISKIKAPEAKMDNEENLRPEGAGWETNPDFREIMFDNAPFVDENLIIAEVGHWKK
jgi:hypothetical protein